MVGVVLDLDRDLFFSSLGPCPCLSGGEFFVVSLLGDVYGDLEIESISVIGAFGFSLFFVCFSLFVAILMFVSFLAGGLFSVTALIIVFISCISAFISFTSWATTSGFVVVSVSHMIIFFVGDRDILFCHFCVFCCFYHSSCFWIFFWYV